MPKIVKGGQGLFINSNPFGTHRKQSHNPEKLPFAQLGTKIVELAEFTKDKLNVHQVIKNMARSIRVLYNKSQLKERNSKDKSKSAAPAVSRTAQMTPNHVAINLPPNNRVRKKSLDHLGIQQVLNRKNTYIVPKNETKHTEKR